jgi:DNA-binding response OmpR family regulator
MRKKILSVDDDDLNRDILTEHLTVAGYDVVEAGDGDIALKLLAETPGIDAILLDRMMPRLGGMEVLKAVKADPRHADIPVIMQSGAAERGHVLQGINAGVYYYLKKPYEKQMLLAIVGAALKDAAGKKMLRDEAGQQTRILGLMERARFRFRTLEDARSLAFLIANCFPEPQSAVYGLNELLVNAVEHGNLGITYAEKTTLVLEGSLADEIGRRLSLPENQEKWGYLSFETAGDELRVHIKDEGQGFDWRPYLELSPERATHPHGRGIATSRLASFTAVEYTGCGNEVVCTQTLTGRAAANAGSVTARSPGSPDSANS